MGSPKPAHGDAGDGDRGAGSAPGTSKAAPGHKIYPYLLRGLKIVETNHVWAADVTYIPMACGFLYLVAIIDWASRAVLAWRLSNTNDASCARRRWRRRCFVSESRGFSIPIVKGSRLVSGRPDSNTDRPTGRLAPVGRSGVA